MKAHKFFIVGCPRSGTTMVQQALNRHSRIAIPPETKFFFSFVGQSRESQKQHLERLNRDLDVQLELPAAGVRTEDEARDFYERMARQYLERLHKRSVTHFGEKTPEHTGHLERIRQTFPDAKIVVLCRDGRDVALSLTKTPWMPGGLYVSFLVWLYYQSLILRAKSSGWSNLHFVRYEDVVAHPQREFRDVLDFLELPYESSVAEGFGNREGIPEREYAWKATALQKITTERVGVFLNELPLSEIAILERMGHKTLSTFGYPLQTDGKTPLSLGVLMKLSSDLGWFLSKMPWNSVWRELAGRVRSELSGWFSRRLMVPRYR